MADEQTVAPEEPTPSPSAAPVSKVFPTEEIISWILRIGVLASAVLIALGVVVLFVTGTTGYSTSYLSITGVEGLVQYYQNRSAEFPTTPGDVLAGVVQFKAYALIALGLLLMIATPVLRVAASVVIFLLERDYAYVLITLIVLTILIVGFLLGKAA